MTSQDGRPEKAHLKRIVAANIDRGIRQQNLTNRALGEALGKTEHQVWRWRTGRHLPEADTLMKLADQLYDGKLGELYEDGEVPA